MSIKLALKIDVDTYRGTREGVLPLARLLQKHGAGATFLFSLGPDHTGRSVKRALRPGFAKKVSRTSVVEHYGIKTLLYGTLLPGPDIGRRCAGIMRETHEMGFEVGVHAFDHVKWHNNVMNRGAAWTAAEMRMACDRFEAIFGEAPRVHGAAGWQMNRHAFRLAQRLFDYCSNTRGGFPYIPVHRAEIFSCPELPTTLPTLDELIGVEGIDDPAQHLLKLSENPPPTGHVYTLHAEMEGMKLIDLFEKLICGWREQGYELVSLADYAASLDKSSLPRHEVDFAEIPGRAGVLAMQGKEFLA